MMIPRGRLRVPVTTELLTDTRSLAVHSKSNKKSSPPDN